MCYFFLDFTYKGCHMIFLSLSDLLYSVWQTLCSSMLQQMALFWLSDIPLFIFTTLLCLPLLLYPIFCWYAFRLLPGNCKSCCYEVLGWMYLFKLWIYLGIYRGVWALDNMVALFLVYCWTSMPFSIVILPIYLPTKSAGDFPFLHTFFIIFCL